jgi:hypothetical protein
MELNGLENEENHKAALSLRSAKSKIRQEQLVDMIDRGVGQPAGSLVDDGSSDEVDEAKKGKEDNR